MTRSKKNGMHPAARLALAGVLALGLAACEKKPAPPPPPPAKPAVKPVETPPAPPAAEQKPAPAPVAAPVSADQALAAKVAAALGAVKGLGAGTVDVQASDGHVKLYGTADNATQLREAAKAAAAVPGVKSVENHIAVVSGS